MFWETSAVTSVGVVGSNRSVQTVENCKQLRAAVEAAPWTSFCQCISSLHFLFSTAHQKLKHDLKPILPDGKIFANSFSICNYWKTRIFFTDEAHLKLNRWVTKQNIGYWSADNPNLQITISLHSKWVKTQCVPSLDLFFGTKMVHSLC